MHRDEGKRSSEAAIYRPRLLERSDSPTENPNLCSFMQLSATSRTLQVASWATNDSMAFKLNGDSTAKSILGHPSRRRLLSVRGSPRMGFSSGRIITLLEVCHHALFDLVLQACVAAASLCVSISHASSRGLEWSDLSPAPDGGSFYYWRRSV